MSDNPLQPSPTLLCKLASIAVHVEDKFNEIALETLLADVEIKDWLAAMDKLSMLPVKRGPQRMTYGVRPQRRGIKSR